MDRTTSEIQSYLDNLHNMLKDSNTKIINCDNREKTLSFITYIILI